MKAYEAHRRDEGKEVSHSTLKEALATFAVNLLNDALTICRGLKWSGILSTNISNTLTSKQYL